MIIENILKDSRIEIDHDKKKIEGIETINKKLNKKLIKKNRSPKKKKKNKTESIKN